MRYSVVFLLSVLCCHPLLAAGQSKAAAAYAPELIPCPSGVSLVRDAGSADQSLSDGEAAYVSAKQKEVLPQAWLSYLQTVLEAKNADALPTYVSEILAGQYGEEAYPRFAIATSGGGYRAATFGAGVLNALDGRNSTSVLAGTGGLLQAATYLAALSGGNWLVSSLAQADFPTLPDLVFGPDQTSVNGYGGWLADFDLLSPSSNVTLDDEYVLEILEEIEGKYEKGFPVTVTDVWARALSRHFVNGTTAANFWDPDDTHGAGLTFSSISTLDTFTNYTQPFPILVIDTLSPNGNDSNIISGGNFVPLTNPIFEVNVYEFGSFDPMLAAFTPTEYLGSPNSSICATGFDQIAFIEGLSSNLFNEYNTSATTLKNSSIYEVIELLAEYVPEFDVELVVGLVSNAFYGYSPETFIDSNETLLQLVDGGEDGEVVPFMPLLVKAREVDVIFAIDAASDTDDHWADGSSIIATQDRVAFFPGTYSFPSVPTSASEFTAHDLTKRPTFFGCNSSEGSDEPLVIYLANGGAPLGQTPVTNTSTEQMQYTADELQAMLSQTFDVATKGIAIPVDEGKSWEKDPEWPACLACAIVDRSRQQQGIERSGVCHGCLEKYCWS